MGFIIAICIIGTIVSLYYLLFSPSEDVIKHEIKMGERCLKCKKEFEILESKNKVGNESWYFPIYVCDECFEKYYKDKENNNE